MRERNRERDRQTDRQIGGGETIYGKYITFKMFAKKI